MSLLLDERSMSLEGELLLHSTPLRVACRVTVEWLRGIPEPTWYGYFQPIDEDISVLPGRYRLQLPSELVEILVRRSARLGDELCFPFWGFGHPPAVSPEAQAGADEHTPKARDVDCSSG